MGVVQPNRLADGGRVDRGRPVHFTFNGRRLQAYPGDTLASALLANGIRIVGRSFKYGRPRGIVGHGVEEPNAIVQIGRAARTSPNLRATQVEIYEGLEARSVAGWPSVGFDLKSMAGWFARLMPPGFYYKTFMWPAGFWKYYERVIRKAAGLGQVPRERDPDRYDKFNHHCDVLVVWAGQAGLAAARAAAGAGARVIIADEQQEPGGSLLSARGTTCNGWTARWLAENLEWLNGRENVTMLPRSTVFGYYDHNFLAILERSTDHLPPGEAAGTRQRLHRVRAKQVILATGAIERPLVFANNDVPGVMLASSVSTYVNRYGVAPGQRLVLFTANDGAYQCALDWHRAGRDVVAVIDVRAAPGGPLPAACREAGIEVIPGHAVIEVKGRRAVRAAVIAPVNGTGDALTGPARRLKCDLIASSGGWSPSIHLSSQAGSKPRWSDEAIAFLPGEPAQQHVSVGGAAGAYTLRECIDGGAAAGAGAAARTGHAERRREPAPGDTGEQPEQSPQAAFLVPHPRGTGRAPNQFVDFQLDVTAAGIELAAREGYESIEHVKRYTALGFGTDQGKLGNVNGIAILAGALGQGMAETGTTVFRPAYTPATFGALAGRDLGSLFDPERYTAMHRWHEEHGAEWENVGQWKRPWYYPRAGETMQQAVERECLAVRNRVGLLDASTLGKIDIQGRDAAEFITRIYTNSFLKLEVGKCRYGLMLKEDGMIFDDGVTARIDENRFLMHTTTGGAAAVLAWLESWHQTEWPDLEVFCTSVTDHWATATLSGPDARKVLARVCDDIDLGAERFRFMEWRDGTVAGVAARVYRISFTGELSYEVNVPAHFGRHVWEALIEAGEEFGITPYGTETMHVLRAEKGFIIVGQDTDGSRTPGDMNMDWIVGKNKAFSFVGERSLRRSDTSRADRKMLVGLKTLEPRQVLPEGSQIVNDPDQAPPMSMQGHVTSSYYSAHLGHSIALAVVKGGLSRLGERVYCPRPDGGVIAAEIVKPVFHDPQGERQNV
jgi:sarcosine oxidase subunit alpha